MYACVTVTDDSVSLPYSEVDFRLRRVGHPAPDLTARETDALARTTETTLSDSTIHCRLDRETSGSSDLYPKYAPGHLRRHPVSGIAITTRRGMD